MLGSISFHILWALRSVFFPCPHGIVVMVFHFGQGGRKANQSLEAAQYNSPVPMDLL